MTENRQIIIDSLPAGKLEPGQLRAADGRGAGAG